MTRAVAHDSDVLGRAVARAKSMTVSKEAKEASCIVHLRQSKAWRDMIGLSRAGSWLRSCSRTGVVYEAAALDINRCPFLVYSWRIYLPKLEINLNVCIVAFV